MSTSSNNNRWWLLIGTAVFLFLLYYLSSILVPFLIAALLAYLGDPLVRKLKRLGIPRTFAVVIVFIILFSIILILLLLLIPLLEKQALILINKIPQFINWVQMIAVPWISKYLSIQQVFDQEKIKEILIKDWQQAGNVVGQVIKTITYSGYTLFALILTLILVPIVTFYFLRDWEKLIRGIRRLFPRRYEPVIIKLLHDCDEVIGAFFRGQLLVMLSLAIYYSIALWLTGLELALLIGIIIGFVSIIPYLGFLIGIVLASIIALIQFYDWWHLLYIAIVFIIGHILENYFLAPRLVGERIGLHPVAVIFAVLAGGQLFGFVGVLLALPVAAVIMVLIRYLQGQYYQSHFYNEATKNE